MKKTKPIKRTKASLRNAALKAWATRRENEKKKKNSTRANKAWATRKKNQKLPLKSVRQIDKIIECLGYSVDSYLESKAG